MSAAAFTSGSSWFWPKEELAAGPFKRGSVPGAFQSDETEEHPSAEGSKNAHTEKTAPKARKHYPPRTCRICLEVVLPTFESTDEGLAGILNPAPQVTYVSSDPESGRLIRPCKCKGSQKYVHEGCLQAWRHSDPSYGRRNFWECPTCRFRYRLERMRWSRWIKSTATQVLLTILILLTTVFLLGFIADPIINLYLDPYETITSVPFPKLDDTLPHFEDEDTSWLDSWLEHYLKGLASLGLLGAVKALLAMSPWQWWNLRTSGIIGGGNRAGRGNTGRERLENISWSLVAIGVATFLWAVWKAVRAWCRRTLEKAGERIVDVQGDVDDEDEEVEDAGVEDSGSGPT